MRPACIALDLDGTTLQTGGTLSDYTKQILETLGAAGVHIVVASGRSFTSLPREVLDLAGVEYAVCSNGASVWHVPSGECIHRIVLPAEAVDNVFAAMEGEKIRYECFIEGKPYADAFYVADPVACGALPRAIPYIRSTRQPVEDITGFVRAHAFELENLDVIVAEQDRKAALWEKLASLREDLFVTSSVHQLLEIAHRDAGKKNGLAVVLDRLALDREQAAAFGDADNDVDMLRWVGCGVAMANAPEEVQAAADQVTGTNDEDGVARMLAHWFGLYMPA
ncbi:MAG: HAD family phosphatase [Butyricicoccus sp.]|nr:HAD family phosphatase [Butyricicoccus sp.]